MELHFIHGFDCVQQSQNWKNWTPKKVKMLENVGKNRVLSAAIIKPKKTYEFNLRKLDNLKNLSSLSSLKKREIMTITKQVKSVLPFKVGAVLDIAGKVQKVVKRDGQFKLVIEPGDVPGFVVFADCQPDAEPLTKANIRKGSSVRVKGKFQTFGAAAVCLSECKLEQFSTLKKRNKRNNSTRTRTE